MRKTLLLLVFVMSLLLLLASCGEEPCTHENTEVKDAVAATCAAAGHTGKTVCKDCEEIISEGEVINALGHSYNGGVVTTAATCGTDGVKTFTCTRAGCSATRTESIAATGEHFDLYQDALDNTHAHACIHCPLNEYEAHTPFDAGTHVEATCVEPGYTVLTCADCDGVYKVYDEGGSALGHDYGAWTVTVAATCKTEGETTHTCSRCLDTETITLSVNARAHKYDDGTVTTEPSCCAEGVRTFTCLLCGDRSKTSSVARTAHEYDAGVANGETGWVTQTCQTCVGDSPATRVYYDASTLKKAELPVQSLPQDANLELGMENATLEVPKEVVQQLGSATNVEVKAEFVEPDRKASLLNQPTMTEEQKQRLQNEEIYDFGIAADGTPLEGFNAAVTVTVPYTLKDGEDAEGIKIWYVKDNGEIETVTAVYNETTETVTFSVSHFSYYAVAYEESQAMKCRRGVHLLAATAKSQTASCDRYGYTVYECSYCKYEELGNFVEKKDHTWGAVQQPTVTCTEGGYSFKDCTVCEARMELNYVRANGHTTTGVPTCENGVSCSVCKALVKPALGHSFGEWAVTVQPTPTTEGEKARTCSVCAKKESVRLAPEGEVEAYEFETIDDYYIFFFREFTGLEKGRFTIAFDMGGMKTSADVSFDTTNDKLTFVAKTVTTTQVSPEKSESTYNDIYYDGARCFVYNDGDVMVQDLEALMSAEGITVELIYGLVEEAFEMVNPMVEPYLDVAAEALKLLPASSAEKLAGYVDSIRTVYAYYALRLGFDTNIEMVEGVKIPTPKDYKNVVEALMVEDPAKPGTYTFSQETIYNLIDDVCAYLDDNAEVAVGKLVFDALEGDIKAVYADVTSYETLIAKLKTEFPGTMTVKDALLKLVKIALTTDMTLADIYEVLDLVLNMNAEEGAEKVSSEQMLAQYFNMTLNDVATMAMSAPEGEAVTMEQLFAMLEQMAAMKLKDVSVTIPAMSEDPEAQPTVVTPAMISGILEDVKAQFALTLNATLVLDGEGSLVSVNVGFGVAMNPPAEAPAGTKPMEMLSGSLVFSNTPDLTPPATLNEYVGIDVSTTVDEKGNLIISGVDSDIAFVFELFGDHTYALSSLLERDAALSAELGYDVYKLAARWSTDSYWSRQLVKINGKYYDYEYVYEFLEPTKETGRVALNTFLQNPTAYLPAANAERVGIISSLDGYKEDDFDLDEEISVYLTYAGFVYKKNGVWYLIDAQSSRCESRYFWDNENDEDVMIIIFDEQALVSTAYAEAFAGASLATYAESIEGFSYDSSLSRALRTVYGDTFVNEYGYVGVETQSGGLTYMLAAMTKNGIELVLGESRMGENESYALVTNAVNVTDLKELEALFIDYVDEETASLLDIHITTDDGWWSSGNVYVLNGIAYEGMMEMLQVELHIPQYFRKIEEGVYVSLGTSGKGGTGIGFADVSQYQTMNVNGKTLYVKGRTNTYTYGYVQLPNGEYIQACVDAAGNFIYRDQSTDVRIDLNDIYDVEDFVTKDAMGNYVVSAELFSSLKSLLSEDESYYILMMNEDDDLGNGNELRIELPVYSTVKTPEISASDILNEIMGGNSSENEGLNWWSWFNEQSYSGVSVVPNADGTVSIYEASGAELKLSFSGKSFSVGPYAVKDEARSAAAGHDVYTANKTETNVTADFVMMGGKYYYMTRRYEYDISYFSGTSQINLKDWELCSLTLVIPKSEGGSAYNIYLGRVYFDTLSASKDFYFVYEGGALKVLTGVVRDGGEDAIRFEGMVAPETYFSSLKLDIAPLGDGYSYRTYTVKGKEVNLWDVRVDIIEPASLGGFTEDTNVLGHYVYLYAAKNGSRVTYVKELTSHNKAKLVIGSEYIPQDGYVFNRSYIEEFENGSFEIVDFKYTRTTTHSYVKLCGEFYEMNDRWSEQSCTAEDMRMRLYDTVYIWVKEGTSELLIEDNDALVPYDDRHGALDLSLADETYEDVSDGEFTYTKYVFYMSTDSVRVYSTEIGGDTVYYRQDGYGYIKVTDDLYIPCWVNVEDPANVRISHVPYLQYGYADDVMMQTSPMMKQYVTSKLNGRVIDLKAGIMELLGEDFQIAVKSAATDSTIGYIYDWQLRDAFDRAQGFAGDR